LNPLILKIQEELNGIKAAGQFFKVTAYTNDLTVGIGSSLNWVKLVLLLQKYELASNAKINQKKSILHSELLGEYSDYEEPYRTYVDDTNIAIFYSKAQDFQPTTAYTSLIFCVEVAKKKRYKFNYWSKDALLIASCCLLGSALLLSRFGINARLI
ncbi:8467_t:CDS:2, partial [Gigaspora rosea]